jgi:hypothetical protein
MVVPDLEQICEIMLFSEGFDSAKVTLWPTRTPDCSSYAITTGGCMHQTCTPRCIGRGEVVHLARSRPSPLLRSRACRHAVFAMLRCSPRR